MEETSLARQLRKLAAPQTSILKDSKIRASFLFDPREAAAVDNDTAFAIGKTNNEGINDIFWRYWWHWVLVIRVNMIDWLIKSVFFVGGWFFAHKSLP